MTTIPTNPYETEVDAAATKYNIPASLLDAQEWFESGFNPGAVSLTGAFGISQFEPATAKEYGAVQGTTTADVTSQINAQADLMSTLLSNYGGSITDALSAYNAGGNQSNWNNSQTTNYVSEIEGALGGETTTSTPATNQTASLDSFTSPLTSVASDVAKPLASVAVRLTIVAVGILLVLVALFGIVETDSQTSVVTGGVSNMRKKAQS